MKAHFQEYIELAAVPILLIANRYLIILSLLLSNKVLKEHINMETKVIGSFFEIDIDDIKWFEPAFFSFVFFITLGCGFILYLDVTGFNFVIGFYLAMYGLAIGRSLSSIMFFRYLNNNPNEISGKINLSHSYSLKQSQYSILSTFIPILFLFLLRPNIFLTGAVVGCLFYFIRHYSWKKRPS